MAKINIIAVAVAVLGIGRAAAQNEGGLPEFSLENLGKNRTLISWVNNFGDGLIQVNVQASYDSLRNFQTVFEPLSPGLPQNGFVNNKGYEGKVYYRLFYVLTGGAYYFSPSKAVEEEEDLEGKSRVVKENTITVRTPLSILAHLRPVDFAKFRDSIASSTKDTLVAVNPNEMVLKFYGHADLGLFLGYIGLNAEGFVEIKLPDAATKKYRITFSDNNGGHLFTINHITDTDLVLDKTNFLHAGWYAFELYQDDKIIEKNKIYLQSDF